MDSYCMHETVIAYSISPSPSKYPRTFLAATFPIKVSNSAGSVSRTRAIEPKCCNSFSAVLVPMPGISVNSVLIKSLLRWLR